MVRVLTGGACYRPSFVLMLPQPLGGAQHPRRYGPACTPGSAPGPTLGNEYGKVTFLNMTGTCVGEPA